MRKCQTIQFSVQLHLPSNVHPAQSSDTATLRGNTRFTTWVHKSPFFFAKEICRLQECNDIITVNTVHYAAYTPVHNAGPEMYIVNWL